MASEDLASDSSAQRLMRMIPDGASAEEVARNPATRRLFEQALAQTKASIRQAAEAGIPDACLLLAKLLRHDPSIHPANHTQLDYVEAALWLRESAASGDAEGQHLLGQCLVLGRAFLTYIFQPKLGLTY